MANNDPLGKSDLERELERRLGTTTFQDQEKASGPNTGFPEGYEPPTGRRYTPPPFNQGGGLRTRSWETTVLGTPIRDEMYDLDADSWKIPLSDPEDIPDLKMALYEAGLLDRKTFGNPAVWDANAAAAYSKVLEFANGYGMRAVDAIKFFPRVGDDSARRAIQQPTETYTNPMDVQAQYRGTSAQLTGMEQPTGDFESYYRGLEQAANQERTSDYYAGMKGTGSGAQSQVQAPSLASAAEAYTLQNNPQSVASYGVASRMLDFFSMLGQ